MQLKEWEKVIYTETTIHSVIKKSKIGKSTAVKETVQLKVGKNVSLGYVRKVRSVSNYNCERIHDFIQPLEITVTSYRQNRGHNQQSKKTHDRKYVLSATILVMLINQCVRTRVFHSFEDDIINVITFIIEKNVAIVDAAVIKGIPYIE